jgi:hypothetical protein
MQQVHPLDPQADQLAPAQPTVGGDQHQRPIPAADGVGQGSDLGDGGKPHLRDPLLAGAPDRARIAEQVAGLHRRAEDARQQPSGCEDFLYTIKAGPAGGRLRRPSSRRQRHDGHRGAGLTV